MITALIILAVAGIAVDIWFIKTEYAGQMKKATILKGCASAFFVAMGLICYINRPGSFGLLILIGLILGMIGDILMNMRNLYEGKKSMIVFAGGILAFLVGHFMYIACLFKADGGIWLTVIILTAVLAIVGVPQLMKRITAPNKGLKIFGIVYLTVVIAMFSSALALWIRLGTNPLALTFTVGAFLFMVSDFIMIYYNFGKKIKPLRAINLLTYYAGQILIALCILMG